MPILPAVEVYKEFITQAYQQIGIEVQVKTFPPARALKLSNEGKADGEVGRTPIPKKLYPNLIPIRVPISSLKISVYSKNKDLKVNGMKSIASLKIGVLRGAILTDALTKGLDTHKVNNLPALFGILQKGRVDVVLFPPQFADPFLKFQPKFSMIHRIGPLLVDIPIFHYLHKKNQHLIPKIQPILEKMVADKVFDKIRAKAKKGN